MASGQKAYDPAEVNAFRELRDRDFRNSQLSPLRSDYFLSFEGLKYFPVDERFAIEAAYTENTGEKHFVMSTTIGRSTKYLKVGTFNFVLEGENFALNAYQRETPGTVPAIPGSPLFVPFKDLTSGKVTYGGGRYLYISLSAEKKAVLDFNMAINPSCAYGDESFSCTIPPKENYLKVAVKAGEKIYR